LKSNVPSKSIVLYNTSEIEKVSLRKYDKLTYILFLFISQMGKPKMND
jgi:hypothetical protein